MCCLLAWLAAICVVLSVLQVEYVLAGAAVVLRSSLAEHSN
jgi:hypothetical protein